jgi:peptide/nickel transport system permease protein
MIRLVAVRVGTGLLTLWLVSILVFAGTEVLPGDAAQAILGQSATPESLAVLREQLDLDRPAVVRYGDWVTGLVHGDLGTSVSGGGERVSTLVGQRLVNTLTLALAATLVFVPLSLLLGTLAAVRRYRPFDHVTSNAALVLIALPEFVTGTLLVLGLALAWPVLPAVSLFDPADYGWQHPRELVLPVVTLVAACLPSTARMVRGSVIEVLERDHVQMARLKGMQERRIVFRHVLPNALVPTLQIVALNIAWLLGGVVVVEFVFQYPGLGEGLVNAVGARDIPTVQAIAMILSAGYILVNLAADVATILLTPRLRTSLS